MMDFINSQFGFVLITTMFLCGIVFNGVATYCESRQYGKVEKFLSYLMHFALCAMSINGYVELLKIMDFSKIMG
ncbi:hypothetical protein [Aeromonas phage AS-zj]|uniref:Uncharacterized protein n=1 Tax=Aeromonas phage AS-zj TaxID=2024208 RepID=A0A223LD00_9CAUD|nr:hypothetical protein HWB28_gp232 [Aeromonas phage AS-zj]ASU00320.1 hypothetical protein [Aeromonas phage AS-zj]